MPTSSLYVNYIFAHLWMRIGSEVADNLMAEWLLIFPSGRNQVIGRDPIAKGTRRRGTRRRKDTRPYLVGHDAIHEGLPYALACDRTHHQVWEAPFYGHKQIQDRSLKWVV